MVIAQRGPHERVWEQPTQRLTPDGRVFWRLLRDGVRTLMKATLLIREAGLRGRMQAPEEFLRRMTCRVSDYAASGLDHPVFTGRTSFRMRHNSE